MLFRSWEIMYVGCMECLNMQKNLISRIRQIQREIVYIRCTDCLDLQKKIEYLELRKFDRKLCTQDVRIACICGNVEYPKLRNFNGKLCTLYVQNV